DMFDCVMPTRLARHGIAMTPDGPIHINNQRWKDDPKPRDPEGHPQAVRSAGRWCRTGAWCKKD
ncbi:MAG: hypothetical protein IKY91_06245, partial [Akkermansia sp.]|nr:hypothetical protein [Akkermansia sp.]